MDGKSPPFVQMWSVWSATGFIDKSYIRINYWITYRNLLYLQIDNSYDVLRGLDERYLKGNKNIILDLASDKELQIVLRQVCIYSVFNRIDATLQ